MDEDMGLIELDIFDSLLFNLDGLTTPWAIWTKFHNLFGTVNEFHTLQLDVELTPTRFPTIKDFLMKFKSLCLVLQGCWKNKIDDESIFLILLKL